MWDNDISCILMSAVLLGYFHFCPLFFFGLWLLENSVTGAAYVLFIGQCLCRIKQENSVWVESKLC